MRTKAKRGRRLTHVTAECGCEFRTHYDAATLSDCTADCPRCGALLIFRRGLTGTAVKAYLFHLEMNRNDPRWPADGRGTGSVSF